MNSFRSPVGALPAPSRPGSAGRSPSHSRDRPSLGARRKCGLGQGGEHQEHGRSAFAPWTLHPAVEDRDSEIRARIFRNPHRDAGRAATTYRLPEPGGARTVPTTTPPWSPTKSGTLNPTAQGRGSTAATKPWCLRLRCRSKTDLAVPCGGGLAPASAIPPLGRADNADRKPEKQSFTYPGLGPWARTALAVVAAVLIILAVIALILYFSFRLLNSPVNGIPQSSQSVSAPPAPSPTSPSLSSEETFR